MDILYSCKDFTVCVKPAGTDSEFGMPQALSAALGGEFFPVHRLDANVGGIMVYARNKNACTLLSRAFAEGKTEKEYVALVHGTPPPSGEMNDLLFKDSRRNKVYVVSRPRAGESCIPGAAIRYGCSLQAAAFPLRGIINTAAARRKRRPCFSAAACASPSGASSTALISCRSGRSRPPRPRPNKHARPTHLRRFLCAAVFEYPLLYHIPACLPISFFGGVDIN